MNISKENTVNQKKGFVLIVVLLNSNSINRHILICKKAPKHTVCQLNESEVVSTLNHVKKQNIAIVEQYLQHLRSYLEKGGFVHSFKVTRDKLRPKTVIGYVSSIRKFLEALWKVIQSKNQECTLNELLVMSIQVNHIHQYFSNRTDKLVARTIVNYSAAIQWHFVYLRYLAHEDTQIRDSQERLIQQAIFSSFSLEKNERKKKKRKRDGKN